MQLPKIVFGVTVSGSVQLLGPLPVDLARSGWEVHVVSGAGPDSNQLEKNSGVYCHRIPMRRDPSILHDVVAFFHWLKVLQNIGPDIVVAATPKASFLAITAASMLRVPKRVYLAWGLRFETTSGVWRALLIRAERITCALSTSVLAVSSSLRAAFIDYGLCSEDHLTVLGNGSSRGVNLRRFRPLEKHEKLGNQLLASKIGLRPNTPTIGLFGRQAQDKGLDVFLRALAEPCLGNEIFQVLFIGVDESQGQFREAQSRVSRPMVRLGPVDDIERYYRLLDVLCLPTLREGMPNVVLEALATGVPVVTTDATGARDSIKGGWCGLLVPKGSVTDLAVALKKILGTTELRSALSANARPWVAEHFAEERVTTMHERYFTDLLLAR